MNPRFNHFRGPRNNFGGTFIPFVLGCIVGNMLSNGNRYYQYPIYPVPIYYYPRYYY